mmetsp:Transcript_84159/g.212216  ORF Transcript_84159/g.212216 Transcript_84159/m.212216 type:complete len:516 (+) Transcript_84159:62-1609(+)
MSGSLLAVDGREACRPLAAAGPDPCGARAEPNCAQATASASTTTSNAKAAPRLEALDALRWIASIQIVFSHFYIDEHKGRSHWFAPPDSGEWWPQFARYGKMWTQFFFILSGFVLGYAEMTRAAGATRVSQLQYLRRRLVTIYPTYVFSLLAYMLQVQSSGQVTNFQWASMPPSLLLVQSWVVVCGDLPMEISSYSWNVPAWFLSALMLYWLTLRPVARFFRSRSLSGTCLCLLSLWAFSLVPGLLEKGLPEPRELQCMYYNLQNGSIGYFHVFFAGVATARLFILTCLKDAETGCTPNPKTKIMVLSPQQAPVIFRYGCCIGYLAYALFFLFVDMEVMFMTFHNGGIMPIMVLLVLGGAIGADPLVWHVLQRRAFVLLGQLSYAQYLMQVPVFMFFLSALRVTFDWTKGPPVLPSGALVVFPFVLVLVGYLVQRYVQRPYTEWQRWRQEKGIVGTDERAIAWIEGLAESLGNRCNRLRSARLTEAVERQGSTGDSPSRRMSVGQAGGTAGIVEV